MNKRLMSTFLVIALLFSFMIPVVSVYAQDEYEKYVCIEIAGEKIEKKEIKVGETINLYAKVVDAEGKEDTYWDDLEGDVPSYTQYKWSSEDEEIATATPEDRDEDIGNITGIAPGTVKIKVESKDCKKCEPKEIEIKVIEDKPKYERHVEFRNKPEKTEIKVGETLNLYMMVVDSKGEEDTYWDDLEGDVPSYTQYKWSSEDEEIATATPEDRDEDIGNVTGIAPGTVKIKVESKDCKNCEPKEIEIKVIEDKPKYERHVEFRNKPEKTEIKVGETLNLYMMIVDAEGEEDTYYYEGASYKWSSEDEKIATATSDDYGEDIGNIIGIAPGIVKIKVESIDCKNCEPKEIEIKVIEDEASFEEGEIDNINISLDKDIQELECGRNMKLNVSVKDTNGKEIKNPKIKWKVDPIDCVMIDDENIIHTLKEGNISIEAIGEKNDEEVVSNTLTLKIIESKNRKEKIQEAIDNLIIRYKNPTFYGNEYTSHKYIQSLALSLRYSGMDIEEINNTKKLYRTGAGAYHLINNAKNIMTCIAVNEDPKEYVDKILDSSFVFYKDIDEDNTENLIYAIIALDMAGADYNKKEAVEELINRTKKDSNGNVYFESYGNLDASLTAKALIALSNHKESVLDTIEGIKKCLKSLQSESGLIKEVNDWGNEENCMITAQLIQGIIALGEDPLDEYWMIEDKYKNKNNLVDAMLSCRDGQRFKKSIDRSVADIQTDAAMAALVDLKEEKSMYHNLKYIKVGEPSKIVIQSEESIELIEGEQLELKVSVYDDENYQIKNPSILWESSDPIKATVKDGVIKVLNEGNVKIRVYLENNQEIFDEVTINIKSGISDEVLKERAKEEIEFLKSYYQEYKQYEFLAAPAAAIAGMDKEIIQRNIFRYSKPTGLQYARMIISVIGSGFDPRKDEFKKDTFKNYVDVLRAHQITDGPNKGQFILNKNMDSNNIETLAYCIIALDMADADYNKEDAVKALLKLTEESFKENTLGYEKIKSEAMALTAFSRYKDIVGVPEKVNELIDYLRNQQNEDGGFDANDGYFKNSPIITGTVIQALIANGINPLYDKTWVKNKKTMMDSMLKSKFVCPTGNLKNSGFCQGEGLDFKNEKATYNAFAALIDMYEDVSMFEKLSIKYDESIKIGDVATVSILQPYKDKILIDQTLNLQLVAFDKQYNWIENPSIVWTSSDENIATINNGIITGKTPGKVSIIASVEGTDIKDQIDIYIEDLDVKNIKIQTNKDKIRKEDIIKLDAKAFDKTDTEIKGLKYRWSVDDESRASVYQEGKNTYLKGIGTGMIKLKAVLEDHKNISDEITINIIDKKKAIIKVRVEGLEEAIVPEIELEVDNFDMGAYGDGGCIIKEHPTAMNALIQALKSQGIDCTNKDEFDAKSTLSNLDCIKGLRVYDEGPNSGWMYYINNTYSKVALVNKQIHDGDYICVFYLKDYKKQSYAYFDKTEVVIKPNEDFTLNLKTHRKNELEGYKAVNIENAQILVNKSEYELNGKNLVTNKEGNVTLSFNKEGEYIINAKSLDPKLGIAAAYCKVKVTNDLEEHKLDFSIMDEKEILSGEEAKLTIKVKNKTTKETPMICVIQLCDEENKVLKSSSVEKVLKDGQETILSPGFAVPDDGKYKIKVFLADEKIDPLKPIKVIDIQ